MAGDFGIILNISNNGLGLEKWLRDGVVFQKNPRPIFYESGNLAGTKYVANTLDPRRKRIIEVIGPLPWFLTFVEYTLLGTRFFLHHFRLQKYVIGAASSSTVITGCIALRMDRKREFVTDSHRYYCQWCAYRISLFRICLYPSRAI